MVLEERQDHAESIRYFVTIEIVNLLSGHTRIGPVHQIRVACCLDQDGLRYRFRLRREKDLTLGLSFPKEQIARVDESWPVSGSTVWPASFFFSLSTEFSPLVIPARCLHWVRHPAPPVEVPSVLLKWSTSRRNSRTQPVPGT